MANYTPEQQEYLKAVGNRIREIRKRFDHMKKLGEVRGDSVDADRNYVTAMLHLQVYCHKLYKFAETGPT